jgi:hypothetical protein
MECQYCKRTLKNISSLNAHQKRTKYCLIIQGKLEKGPYICDCGKDFYSKHHLISHQDTCIIVNTEYVYNIRARANKSEEQVLLLRIQLEDALRREQELREDFNKLAAISAKRSTTTTNNTTNNLNLGVFDKSSADIKLLVDEHYDRTYLIQGQKGVAIFTNKHVLNKDPTKPPIYVITDRSRGNGKYKISDTEVVTDTGMSGLTKKVHPSIKSKAVFITSNSANPLQDDEMMAGYHEVFEMDHDNGVFRSHLGKIMEAT